MKQQASLSTRVQTDWYETTLPHLERKQRGHFSTPLALVERILTACHYLPTRDLTNIRVLDPACGSGNFLLPALKRLLQSCEAQGLTSQEAASTVERLLFGYDPDPVACTLTELRLLSHLDRQIKGLSVRQADSLSLQWSEEAQVDLLLANPPYLASKNKQFTGYEARGQSDSYLHFLNIALKLVKPGGWLALVLPDPFLIRENARAERAALLEQTSIQHLWHIDQLFPASVGAAVIIAHKHPPTPTHHVQWERSKWNQQGTTTTRGSIAQQRFQEQKNQCFRYLLSQTQDSLLARLHAHWKEGHGHREGLTSLGELMEIRRGEELGKQDSALSEQAISPEYLPVLRGGVDIQANLIPQATHWIKRKQVQKNLNWYQQAKLLIVKSTGTLQATIDLDGQVVLQTLYMLTPRQPEEAGNRGRTRTRQAGTAEQIDQLYALMAVLNSSFMQKYVTHLYTAYKFVQPQLEKHVLSCLPIPAWEHGEMQQVARLARLLLAPCMPVTGSVEWEERSNLLSQQEEAIRALYRKIVATQDALM